MVPSTPPPGMVGWWSGEGSARDSAGGNHGTVQGGTTFAPGWVGSAFHFDGASGSVFGHNPAGLQALQAKWTSVRNYEVRVANLRGTGSGPRRNGTVFLRADGPAATVFDDGARDLLVGCGGRDWFFANLNGEGVRDRTAHLGEREFADDLEFIR